MSTSLVPQPTDDEVELLLKLAEADDATWSVVSVIKANRSEVAQCDRAIVGPTIRYLLWVARLSRCDQEGLREVLGSFGSQVPDLERGTWS